MGNRRGRVVQAAKALGRRPRRFWVADGVPGPAVPARPFSFEDAVALLVSRGVDEHAVRLGTIPESSLTFAREAVTQHCPQRPLRTLHVGNFVGVSLAALSDIVVRHHPESVVVSVDPNLRHHGVHDPQRHVLALLDHLGLQRNSVVICGYSLQRAANETRVGTFADHPAGEETLRSFERLGIQFDLALIDGNHAQDYLRGELDVVVRLLSDGAVLLLDDVFDERTNLPELFDEVMADDSWPLELIGQDDHLAVLRRTAEEPPRAASEVGAAGFESRLAVAPDS